MVNISAGVASATVRFYTIGTVWSCVAVVANMPRCFSAGTGKTYAKATADIPPRCIILTVNIFARVRINIHSH